MEKEFAKHKQEQDLSKVLTKFIVKNLEIDELSKKIYRTIHQKSHRQIPNIKKSLSKPPN